ncbi:MAG: hypothetical protein MPL62_13695 [Alphaproteobacteria bacterium]|nr:hypothetical protein [Alphaproteobacteria bacterium]
MTWVLLFVAVATLLVAASTAVYGWFLFVRLAKNRQAHDLYSSSIALLQELETEGIAAWSNGKRSLDEYTELKLTSRISGVEQRLALISKYYNEKQKDESHEITSQIWELRARITQTADHFPSEEDRRIDIHRLTNNMVSELLAENHEHINKHFWLLQWMRDVIAPISPNR